MQLGQACCVWLAWVLACNRRLFDLLRIDTGSRVQFPPVCEYLHGTAGVHPRENQPDLVPFGARRASEIRRRHEHEVVGDVNLRVQTRETSHGPTTPELRGRAFLDTLRGYISKEADILCAVLPSCAQNSTDVAALASHER